MLARPSIYLLFASASLESLSATWSKKAFAAIEKLLRCLSGQPWSKFASLLIPPWFDKVSLYSLQAILSYFG